MGKKYEFPIVVLNVSKTMGKTIIPVVCVTEAWLGMGIFPQAILLISFNYPDRNEN
jgi:hypothetical protein